MIRKPHTPPHEPGNLLEDLSRSARVCHPGWQSVGRITFIAGPGLTPPWSLWRDSVFLPVLVPALEQARSAGAAGDFKALLTCDAGLNEALPPALATYSRAAGAALAQNYTVPVGERLLMRYGQRIASGETPGHLATLLGLRTAIFHLPVSALLGVYVMMEAMGGLTRGGPKDWMEMTEDCLARRGDTGGSQLRAA